MKQNLHHLDELAARLEKLLATDPDHPAASRVRAELDRYHRATRLERGLPPEIEPEHKKAEK